MVLFLIGLFLFLRSAPDLPPVRPVVLHDHRLEPGAAGHAGVAALLYGTVEIAVIALVLAVPIALLTALFLTEYASPALRGPLITVVDLLAAMPSLIYGIWGFFFLQPHLMGVSALADRTLRLHPDLFDLRAPTSACRRSWPACWWPDADCPPRPSVMREVFAQTPPGEKEAALALGGSRWRMIRTVVLPFGRGGIVGGSMLALGRAMGESISVAMVLRRPRSDLAAHPRRPAATRSAPTSSTGSATPSPAHGLQALMAPAWCCTS